MAEALRSDFNLVVLASDRSFLAECTRKGLKSVYLPGKRYKQRAERNFSEAFEGIPLDGENIARMATLTDIRSSYSNAVFISDVSAELTIAARSLGFPTVMMRHSGDVTSDPTQIFAYQCSEFLFAPYPEVVEDTCYKNLCETIYLGFIADEAKKYSQRTSSTLENLVGSQCVSYLTSRNDFSTEVLLALALNVAEVNVIGIDEADIGTINLPKQTKINFRGFVDDISAHLTTKIVVTSAGNNAIGELLQLGKKMVLVPQERPYDEQEAKAKALERLGVASVFTRGESGCNTHEKERDRYHKHIGKKMKAALDRAVHKDINKNATDTNFFYSDKTLDSFLGRLHAIYGSTKSQNIAVVCH